MISSWNHERFGDVCNFVRGPFGGSLKKNIFKIEGYAVYEQQHAIYNQFKEIRYFVDEEKFSEMSRFELFSGDLIMSCSGTMGKVSIVPEGIPRGIINQALLKLTPKKKLLPVFLKFWMQSRNFQEQIELLSQGAAIKNMASVKILKEIKVPTPPINEQKRIVAILDLAFTDIEKARDYAEQNLKNVRELFESYLQQVFSQRGDGWVEKRFDEVCILQRGFDLPKRLRKQGEYPLVSSSGISDSHKEAKVKSPGVVTGRSGSIGNVFYIEKDYWPLNTVLYIKKFQGNNEKFIYWLLRNFDLSRFSGGTGVPSLNRNVVHEEMVVVPSSYDEQIKLTEKLELLEAEVVQLESIYKKKIEQLDELKKSILQKAFTGELTKEKVA